jgi:hypothetical protein
VSSWPPAISDTPQLEHRRRMGTCGQLGRVVRPR